jgi:hypothetical protein
MLWAVLFSGVGLGFFTYGRKQKVVIPFFVGIALCVAPYFIKTVIALVISCTILIAIPYFFRSR